MSSSSATDLFAQAIAQSAPWGPFFRKEIFTEAIYPALLNSTNCTSSGEEAQLSCLRALDAGVFLNGTAFQAMVAASVVAQVIYSQAGQLVSTVEPFLPVVGTGIVDDLTDVLFKNGQLPSKNKPFLIGNMRDEGVSFTTFSLISHCLIRSMVLSQVLFVDSVPQLQNPVPATNGTLQILLTSAVDNSTLLAINANPSLVCLHSL